MRQDLFATPSDIDTVYAEMQPVPGCQSTCSWVSQYVDLHNHVLPDSGTHQRDSILGVEFHVKRRGTKNNFAKNKIDKRTHINIKNNEKKNINSIDDRNS